VVDEPGRNVAWVEYSGEYDAKSVLHTVETESGSHHHFAGQAEHCQITHEYLLGIENGELRTDGECGPGCPSSTRQSEFRTYDVRTGKVTKQWNGDVERPINEAIGARSAMGANLARIFGLASGATPPIKHHPSADLALVECSEAQRSGETPDGPREFANPRRLGVALRSGETPDAPREFANPRRLGIALRLVDHRTGVAAATLERSAEFTVEAAHFWPESGARVVGVGHGEVVVWDSASGKRVWASRR